MKRVIPYRPCTYQTILSEAQIQAAVREHAHIGQWDGMIFKTKPYFGEWSAGFFEIRACGANKKYGYAPSLSAYIERQSTGSQLVLRVKPHPLLLSLALLMLGVCGFFLMQNLVIFFATGNPAPVLMYVFILALVVGGFGLPYHFATASALAFWTKALQLHPALRRKC